MSHKLKETAKAAPLVPILSALLNGVVKGPMSPAQV